MENRKMVLGVIGAVLVMVMFTMCEQWSADEDEPEFKSEFKSSEYIISAGETAQVLNIEEPQYVHSSNNAVVMARIESGGIVISSAGRGRASVYVGDRAGLSNSAQVDVDVDSGGNINTQFRKFDGNYVRAVVKQGVVINGSAGGAIANRRIMLMMDGTHFIAEEGMDASSWINLPPGLSASISHVQAGDYPHEVYIAVSGTPQSASCETLKITIPAANSGRSWDVYVESRNDVRFDVTE